MYNFSNFIHIVRYAARDHNAKCNAQVEAFLKAK
jgi:hypothetical protein